MYATPELVLNWTLPLPSPVTYWFVEPRYTFLSAATFTVSLKVEIPVTSKSPPSERSWTDNLFFAGCENTDNSTVSDESNIYTNQSPAVEVTITSPTQLVTTDSPDTPLDVV